MTLRILITGSRDWTNKTAIARAIIHAIETHAPNLITHDEHGPKLLWNQITIVHGEARGADTHADRIARAWGMQVDPHPVRKADWDTCEPDCKPGHRRTRPDGTTYCPSAGHRRNQRMVNLGADICLAFPIGDKWSGTRDCMQRADAANIPVRCYKQPQRIAQFVGAA